MRILERIACLACTPLIAVCLLAPAASRAADATPTPTPTAIPTLKLNDGRVLHNVQVRKDQDDSIVVLASEGLAKIAKSNLPPDIASAYPARQAQGSSQDMVMQPFNPNPPGPPPGTRAAPRPTPTPKPAKSPVYKGCTIVSFQTKAFQNSLGCAAIVIRNDTDAVVAISPGEIVCVTNTGVRYAGRHFVTDGDTPSIKRQELVPARGDISDIITFTNDALDLSSVQWAR
jgi:hypothetical protein